MGIKNILTKAATATAAAGIAFAMTVGGVSAGTGALSRTGASMTYNNHTKLAYTTFTVNDDKNDGLCARAYMQVGGSYIYMGQACGDGTSTSGTKWGSAERIKLCTGMPNSTSSNCISQKAA